MTAGTLVCFMCEVPVSCRGGSFANLDDHMKNIHKIKRGNSYLLAGCFMSEEERDAVKDVISEKIDQAFQGQEEEPVRVGSGRPGARHRCPQCPISFTVEENLREHLERKHKVRSRGVRITPVVSSAPAPRVPKFGNIVGKLEKRTERRSVPANIKFEATPRSEEEDIDDPLSSSPEPRKNRRAEMKRRMKKQHGGVGRQSTTRYSGDVAQAGPDEDPGSGRECPLCQKEFPANGPMRRHFEDIHQPGEYPCRGCGKVFTSKNKVSSHYSRNCKRRSM